MSIPVDSAARTSQAPATPPASWAWVPIRSLGPRHRERISAHLMALDVSDRYLRFGYPATDAQMSKYVDMLDFEQDEVFGIFNRRLELIAMAHLAHAGVAPVAGRPAMSEFGVSVLPQVRAHALSENVAMLKIARRAGATVERDGSESEAWLKLPPDSFASHVGEMVEQQAAEFDYQFKRRARQVGEILGVISEVKASMGKTAHIAEE
jgi:hypothetical protein